MVQSELNCIPGKREPGGGGGGIRGEWADLTRGIARDFKVVCT